MQGGCAAFAQAASLNLGLNDMYSPDQSEWAKACDRFEQGSSVTQISDMASGMLGRCYVMGTGRPQDLERGAPLLIRGDVAGAPGDLLFLIGRAWENGWGPLDPDASKAFSAFQRASAAGDARADWHAAMHMLKGDGAPKDPAAARRLAERSAQAGYLNAQISFAVMLATGQGGVTDEPAARRWYLKAAEAGSANGLRGLGAMLLVGQGGAPDQVRGCAYLELAAENGDESARLILEQTSSQVLDRVGVARIKAEWVAAHGSPRSWAGCRGLVQDNCCGELPDQYVRF